MTPELVFIHKIDTRLNMLSDAQIVAAIREGCQISDNAAFMVLYELSHMGPFAGFDGSKTLEYLELWSETFDHPLKAQLLPSVRVKVSGGRVELEEIKKAMAACADYPQEINALNTASRLRVNGEDFEQDEIDNLYARIRANYQD